MTTTTHEPLAPEQLANLDALAEVTRQAFSATGPAEGGDLSGLAGVAAVTHRVAWIGGLVAHPTGGVGLSAAIRSLGDGSNVKCYGRITGTGLAVLGSGGFGEFYVDLDGLKGRKLWVSVAVIPGGPGWLPTMWATFYDGHQKIGFIGGAAAGITFPAYGSGYVDFY